MTTKKKTNNKKKKSDEALYVRTEIVSACQWRGPTHTVWPTWWSAVTELRGSMQDGQLILLMPGHRQVAVAVGDWLIRDGHGTVRRLTDDEFRATYTPEEL